MVDSVLDFVEEKIRASSCGFTWLKVLAAFLGENAIASEFADSFSVGEFVRAHGIERFFREARGDRLGCLNERQRGGMRSEKGLNRRGLRRARAAGVNGAEELYELLSGPGGECVYGVRDDVRVGVLGEIKPNGDAPRASILGFVVRYGGNAGESENRTAIRIEGLLT